MVRRVPSAEAPIHLKPAAELAGRALLPGDPQRAFSIASALLDAPRVFNLRRGLWGYTGRAPDGRPLTVQATGMGGPSAAIVVEELTKLGAHTFIRVGTCGALTATLELGQLLVASGVLVADGVSAALGAEDRLEPHRALTEALLEAAARRGGRSATVVSTDLFYDERAGIAHGWRARGAEAVEMEAAAVLRVAERRGARAACLLAVTDLLEADSTDRRPRRHRVDQAALESAGMRLGEVALEALERTPEAGGAPAPEGTAA